MAENVWTTYSLLFTGSLPLFGAMAGLLAARFFSYHLLLFFIRLKKMVPDMLKKILKKGG